MKERSNVTIGDFTVGDNSPVALVAELGVNHLGDFGRAKEMIAAAHESGADFLKFQTYIAEDRYDKQHNPKGEAFIKLLKDWQFSREHDQKLWEYAESLGARVFTSPFDKRSVDFSEEMGSLAYKVAAFEAVNLDLVRHISKTKKPVVVSRGMTTVDEMKQVESIFKENDIEFIFLHCISSYPTPREESNLAAIHTMREVFDCPIGHSDHTHGTSIPPLAVAAGAVMIEKHFTVNQKLRESDNPFSVTAEEMREMRFQVDQVKSYMGDSELGFRDVEKYMWDFRRNTS